MALIKKLKGESKPAIACSGLSKDFYLIDENLNWRLVFRDSKRALTPFSALHDVSLLVPKGKFVGILGRNGAGKSTLLRVLGGVYPPTTGVVRVNGDVSSLFEMGGFGNNRLTGHAYADRYLEIYGLGRKARQPYIHNIQMFSELGESFNKPMYTYSSGMAARLFFATATELQHEIYLVDELLSVGDEHFQAKCWKRLRERFSCGASGILVTHDWSAVLKLCTHAYVLEKGRVVSSGRAENMVQAYLNLPKPTQEYVEIITPPDGYTCKSGDNCTIRFDLFLKKEVDLAISYSVELFRAGHGWELVLLNEDFIPVDCRLGINPMTLKINQLPLVSGTYYLNVFLKPLDSMVENLQLDCRSWTHGNGITLTILGQSTAATVVLPWKKSMRMTAHVGV
jgi:lipopolysaccharide transport system ATP-binding protein